jgi:hypothetical protein
MVAPSRHRKNESERKKSYLMAGMSTLSSHGESHHGNTNSMTGKNLNVNIESASTLPSITSLKNLHGP